MADDSFIAVPPNVSTDPVALRRFLLRLIEQLDVAFGNRGSSAFASANALGSTRILLAGEAADKYVPLDGTKAATGILSYNEDKAFTDDAELVAKKYVDDGFVQQGVATDPTDLALTASFGYVQAELQAVADKVDAILAELRVVGLI